MAKISYRLNDKIPEDQHPFVLVALLENGENAYVHLSQATLVFKNNLSEYFGDLDLIGDEEQELERLIMKFPELQCSLNDKVRNAEGYVIHRFGKHH